jgi:uncharacterized protein
MRPIEQTADRVRLRVRATPRAKCTEIMGVHGGMIRIRLAARPTNGEANEELVHFLAKTLSVSRSAVTVLTGQTSRSKVVEISGVNPQLIAERLKV